MPLRSNISPRRPAANAAELRARYLLLPLLAAMSVLTAGEARGQSVDGAPGVPRIVVNILIDQLRSDYLEAFMPLYGEDGFKRLLREGRVYTQAEYPSAGVDVASAAATVATGSAPASHGITARRWIDRKTLRPVFCVDDGNYAGTGTSADHSSPANLSVSTVGDELKMASDGKALVYAIAPMREAAILTGGHAADAALWIDDQNGGWCSSSYYGKLPEWVDRCNSTGVMNSRLEGVTWIPSSAKVGAFSYFLRGVSKNPFEHKFKGMDRYTDFKTSALVNTEVGNAAVACLQNTDLGIDWVTDQLAVTFYAGNYEHRPVGMAPTELQDTYVRLDKALAGLIDAVHRKVGLQNALFVLTSTGYTDEDNYNLKEYRVPTGTFDMRRATALLNMYLVAVYGQGNFVEACYGRQFYLNHSLIESKQLNLAEVMARAQEFLLQLSGVKDVYTSTRLMLGAWTPGISRIRAGYHPRCSGDLLVEVMPGWHYVNEDTRENFLVRDAYISYPVIFFGHTTQSEKIETLVSVDRIAPTLSKAMRIRAPNACGKAPLF